MNSQHHVANMFHTSSDKQQQQCRCQTPPHVNCAHFVLFLWTQHMSGAWSNTLNDTQHIPHGCPPQVGMGNKSQQCFSKYDAKPPLT